MKWFKRIGLTILVFFVLCVIACASGSLFSNVVNNPSTPEQTELSKDLDKVLNTSNNVEIEYIEVTAEQLIKDYDDNELLADDKYKGKWLIIDGYVSNISKVLDITSVTLNNGEEFSVNEITCFFDKDNESQVKKLEKGSKVKIKGKCKGKGWNVEVEKCIIN